MPLWVDAGDAFTFTCSIGEAGVAAQTKLPATVNIQFFRRFRMVECRPVAVLTRDYAVKLFTANRNLCAVAIPAVFVHFFPAGDSVFCRLLFPLALVGLPVVGVHKTSFPGAKVIGDIEKSKYQ